MSIAPLSRNSLIRKKNLDDMIAASQQSKVGDRRLSRSMSLYSVIMLGVGNVIGTGIFFVLAITVPHAGPSVLISFVIVGVIAGITALCYTEIASTIPVAGSAYSYAMAAVGEFPAYLIGWCLILEYGVGGAATAVGWAEYFNELLQQVFHWQIPAALSSGPFADGEHGIINLPAVILVAACSVLLLRGAQESARINAILVTVKLGVLGMFVVVALTGFNSVHFHPFAPHGFSGIAAALPAIFFTFIGLDVLSTAGEEVKDPQRTIPRAIGWSLVVIGGIYFAVSIAALGAQEWTKFEGQEAGLAKILTEVVSSPIPSIILSLGAVVSVFTVTLTSIYGQSRILFAMGRDGLMPRMFQHVSPRTLSPSKSVMVTGVIIAILAATMPMTKLWDLVSIGTLAAFIVVSVTVIVLRRTRPDLQRGFKVPLYPWLPIASVATCLWVATTIPEQTWIYVGVWMALAIGIYFAYSRRNSLLNSTREVSGLL
jgi:APA family basic amino acid/polyamine antiporter